MARNVAAVIVGIVVVGVVVTALQYLGSLLYPLPEGLDPLDPADAEAMADYVAGMPPSAWLVALVAELAGVFLGALAAGSIARDHKIWFVGGIVALGLAGSIMNWTSFTHPLWFIIIQLIAYPSLLVLVILLVKRPDER